VLYRGQQQEVNKKILRRIRIMTNFKNIAAAIALTVAIASSATFANAGVLLADATMPTCTQAPPTKEKVDSGILVGDLTGIITAGFTGIITAGFTGIITAGRTSDGPVNCGIITAG
jgi:hypothetical protein